MNERKKERKNKRIKERKINQIKKKRQLSYHLRLM